MEHLSWWNNVGSIVIETPAFIIWPPTLTQFHKFKDDITPWFVDCKFDRILIMCAYGMELSNRSRGVMGRKLEELSGRVRKRG